MSPNPQTRILIVEDDADVAASLRNALESEQYVVQWANTGTKGLSYAQELQPHLIILDVRLPDISGFDVCRTLRQQRIHQPILMLTVQRDVVDRVLGLEMGADDYLTKPYSLQELRSRVRALLRRSYGELANVNNDQLHVAGLTIDRMRGQVWRGEQLLNLTPTEFRILVLLATRPGQVFSRHQILEGVWGHTADIEGDNTVNVHIRRLREKIEQDPSSPTLILTVPGTGYRLNA